MSDFYDAIMEAEDVAAEAQASADTTGYETRAEAEAQLAIAAAFRAIAWAIKESGAHR